MKLFFIYKQSNQKLEQENIISRIKFQADIYLLDDPLSAVDTHVAKHIFERCIKKYLESKTVVLVTHQIQFIKFVDQVVIMEKGQVLAEGGFEDLHVNIFNSIVLFCKIFVITLIFMQGTRTRSHTADEREDARGS